MNATINLEKKHFPVLLDELISIISPLYGGTFIDCTFGQGGYSKKILSNKNNKVVALDRDPETLIEAKKLLKRFKGRFRFENEKFSNINELKLSDQNLKAIIFDFGSSPKNLNTLLRFSKDNLFIASSAEKKFFPNLIFSFPLSKNDKPFWEFLIWLNEYPKSKIIPFIL